MVRVTVDGQAVDFPGGQGPVIVNSRTLVPVRGVFETLGFEVDWDNETRTAIITDDNYEILITIDNAVFTVNFLTRLALCCLRKTNGKHFSELKTGQLNHLIRHILWRKPCGLSLNLLIFQGLPAIANPDLKLFGLDLTSFSCLTLIAILSDLFVGQVKALVGG